MNLEDLTIIWNSQDQEPIYLIDRATLHASVKRKGERIERLTSLFEKTMIGVTFAMGVILPIDAWREGDGAHQYVAGALCVIVAALATKWRRERRKDELRFDDSVLGITERALSQIDYQVRRLKTFLWCFHLPIAITAGIGLSLYSNARITWIWAGVIALCCLSYWGTHRDIRTCLLPKRRELDSLREKLTNAESGDADRAGDR